MPITNEQGILSLNTFAYRSLPQVYYGGSTLKPVRSIEWSIGKVCVGKSQHQCDNQCDKPYKDVEKPLKSENKRYNPIGKSSRGVTFSIGTGNFTYSINEHSFIYKSPIGKVNYFYSETYIPKKVITESAGVSFTIEKLTGVQYPYKESDVRRSENGR